jgi:ADP-ribose pyrophosphatase YjhB (NUDIX family)
MIFPIPRETGRWIIPKGWPMAGWRLAQAAMREVYEEAGLIGVVSRGGPVGHYRYGKRLPTGKIVPYDVQVFLLHVRKELIDWPERDQRIRAWFSLEVAAKLVAERDLAKLILGAVSDKLMQKRVRRKKRSPLIRSARLPEHADQSSGTPGHNAESDKTVWPAVLDLFKEASAPKADQ